MSIPIQDIPIKFGIIQKALGLVVTEFHGGLTDDPDLLLFDTPEQARAYGKEMFGKNAQDSIDHFRAFEDLAHIKNPTVLEIGASVFVLPLKTVYADKDDLELYKNPEMDNITAMRCHSLGSHGAFHVSYTTETGRVFALEKILDIMNSDSFGDGTTNGASYRVFFSPEAMSDFLLNSAEAAKKQKDCALNLIEQVQNFDQS